MMVVIVDVHLVAIPLPIAAAVEIVGRDVYYPDMLVVAAGIVFAGNDAVVLVVPPAIVGACFLLFPAFVLTVVVPVVALVLFLALVFAIVVMIVAVLGRSG